MDEQRQRAAKKTIKTGVTFGSALAMAVSYTTWRSVGWAIFHGLLSWGMWFISPCGTDDPRRSGKAGAAVFRIISKNGKTLLPYQFIQEDDFL